MSEHTVKLNDREEEVLQQLMKDREMSDGATIRHLFRMGQMVDFYINMGYKLAFRKFVGFGVVEEIDPFNRGPKKAPMAQEKIDAIAETKISNLRSQRLQQRTPFEIMNHIECPCWTTGEFKRVEGCEYHPYDL